MTVSELIEELRKYPGDMDIVWYGHYDDGDEYMSPPDILMRNVSFDGKVYSEEADAFNPGTRERYMALKVLSIEHKYYK